MRRARFTREARSALLAQTAYYETIRKGLGARFRSEVEATKRPGTEGISESIGKGLS